jgi:hypothetical protein
VIAAALAIFSFGLGVSTELELKSLRDTNNGLAKNQKFIVAQLVELARETDKEVNLVVDQIHWAFIHSNLNQKLIRCVDHLREDAKGWSQGLYHLMAGQLDPAIVSVPDLRRGLLLLKDEVRRVGMKVAPMDNRMEVIFSAPVTTYFDHDTIHVWVSVPLIPEEVPVFELLHLQHQPIPLGDYLVELAAATDEYISKCRRQSLSPVIIIKRIISGRHTFSTESDTCPIALLHREKRAQKVRFKGTVGGSDSTREGAAPHPYHGGKANGCASPVPTWKQPASAVGL